MALMTCWRPRRTRKLVGNFGTAILLQDQPDTYPRSVTHPNVPIVPGTVQPGNRRSLQAFAVGASQDKG
jgi:hypothetical protein